jgi:hypothetical protein
MTLISNLGLIKNPTFYLGELMKILITLYLLACATSCLESGDSGPVVLAKEIATQERELIPTTLNGELGLEPVTLSISPEKQELIIKLYPMFELRPVWGLIEKKYLTPYNRVVDEPSGSLCHLYFHTFTHYERTPFIIDNIKPRHLQVYIGATPIDFNDNAEWIEETDHIKIIIQNFREDSAIKIANKRIIDHRKVNVDTSDCSNPNLIKLLKHPGLLEKQQFYRFRYVVE